MTNEITSYTVRRPGNVAWKTEIKTLAAAYREAKRAERVVGLPHTVYAEHADGSTCEAE
jgi:hypothetical protein